MIEKDNPELSIGKQCKLLSISRSSFYYQPKGETAMNLMLMRQIDEQFLETPFFGVRQMTWHLRNDGHLVNEKRIRPDNPGRDYFDTNMGCEVPATSDLIVAEGRRVVLAAKDTEEDLNVGLRIPMVDGHRQIGAH